MQFHSGVSSSTTSKLRMLLCLFLSGSAAAADDPGHVLNQLARDRQDKGQYAEAAKLYQQSILAFERSSGHRSGARLGVVINLGVLYMNLHQFTKAEQLIRGEVATAEEILGPDSPGLAKLLYILARAIHGQHKFFKAEPLYERARAILEQNGEPEQRTLAALLSDLGMLLHQTGRDRAAETYLVRSVAICETVSGANQQGLVKPLANLGDFYLLTGRAAEAEPRFARALALSVKTFGPDDLVTGEILWVYSSLLRQMNRRHEAKDMSRRSRTILANTSRQTSRSATIEVADLLPRRNR